MDIRFAVEGDLLGLATLMEHVYASFGEEAPSGAALERQFRDTLSEGSAFRFVVAVEDGRLVGLLSLAFCPTTYRAATFAYLDDFHVADAARGRGVGRALLTFAREQAREQGAVEIRLAAATDDHRLLQVYAKAGFKPMPMRWLVMSLDGAHGNRDSA